MVNQISIILILSKLLLFTRGLLKEGTITLLLEDKEVGLNWMIPKQQYLH